MGENMTVPSMDISTFVGSDVSHTSFCSSTNPDKDSSCFTCASAGPTASAVSSSNGTCSCNGHVGTAHVQPERAAVNKIPSVPNRCWLHEITWDKATPTDVGDVSRGVSLQ